MTRLAPILLAASVLAGCGSSAAPRAAGDTPVPTASADTSSAPPSESAAASASPTPSGDPLRCHTGGLSATVGGGEGAAGTLSGVVVLTNTSAATCHLHGYPGMQLTDAAGADLPTTVVRGGGMLPDLTPTTVSVGPGQAASFTFTYTDVPTGSSPCPAAARAAITPPDETDSLTVATTVAPCGGELHVSPVVAGSAGVAP